MPDTKDEPESAGGTKHEASTSRGSFSLGAESPTREAGPRASQTSPVTAGPGEAPKKRRKVNHGQQNPTMPMAPIVLTVAIVQHVFIVGAR